MTGDGPPQLHFDPRSGIVPEALGPSAFPKGAGGVVVALFVGSDADREWVGRAAIEVARTWGDSGSRVFLGDACFHRPTLHQILGAPSSPSLADVVRRQVPMENVVRPVIAGSFLFAPAGEPEDEVSELGDDPGWGGLIAGFGEVGATVFFLVDRRVPGLGQILDAASAIVMMGGATGEIPEGARAKVHALLRADPHPEPMPPGEGPPEATFDPSEELTFESLADMDPGAREEPAPEPESDLDSYQPLEVPEAPDPDRPDVEALEAFEPEGVDEAEPSGRGPAPGEEPVGASAEAMGSGEEPPGAAAEAPPPDGEAHLDEEETPADREEPTTGSSGLPPSRILVIGLILVGVVAIGVGLLRRPPEGPGPESVPAASPGSVTESERERTAPPRDETSSRESPAPPTIGESPADQEPTPAPERVEPSTEGDEALGYSLTLASYRSARVARERLVQFSRLNPSLLFVIAPVSVEGTVYNRLLVAAPSLDGARALRQTLTARTSNANPDNWLIRRTPLAFELASASDGGTAEAEVTAARELGIDAYVLLEDRAQGSVYHVLAGAYRDEAEAVAMRDMLRPTRFSDAVLRARVGRVAR